MLLHVYTTCACMEYFLCVLVTVSAVFCFVLCEHGGSLVQMPEFTHTRACILAVGNFDRYVPNSCVCACSDGSGELQSSKAWDLVLCMCFIYPPLPSFFSAAGSKPVSLSQGSPLTPGPPSLGERGGGEGGGKPNNEINITLPHSNTQAMKKKMIVVQKYELKLGDKGLDVNRGETVLLIRDDGDWLYVKNESGAEGFVPRSHLLSPSTTRTRTNSRSGTALRNITSNGSAVPMHPTRSTDRPQRCDNSAGGHRVASPLSQDESQHAVSNGHPPRLATEALYDHKYSPSSSSGVASLADPFSPGSNQSSNQSPTQENEDRVQSSSSSLNHSHGSYSSYEQSLDTNSQPTLISPLNHIEGGREGLGRGVGAVDKRSSEALPSSNSGRTSSNLHSPSARVPPLSPPPQNSTQSSNVHYVDKTTNHIYSTLEEMPSSPPPPPLPPRNMQAYSASQEPEQSAYSQLDHHYHQQQQQQQQQQGGGGRMHKTCSQEALVHPSHRHNSYSEGWTRDRKTMGHTAIQQSSTSVSVWVCVVC